MCAECPTQHVPPLPVVRTCTLLPRGDDRLPCKLTVVVSPGLAAPPQSHENQARSTLSPKEARHRNRRLLLDQPDVQNLWKLKKRWTSVQKVPNCIPVHASATAFDLRFNMPLKRSLHFNWPNLELNTNEARRIGAQTMDHSPLRSFSRPFSVEEINTLKKKISAKTGSAPSEDDVSYKNILDIDSEELMTFVNVQFNSPFVPMDWRKATVVAIPKKGSVASDPSTQRTIVLESCLLKCLTTLLNTRVQEWAENANLLPPSQNGFRPGRRGNDNVFVFKTVVEKAKRLRTPLYAAFIDLSNAFPSVDRDTLWAKLHRLGMAGPLFDWLRVLYASMSYSVKKGEEMSERFSSDLGILQGDPPSPTLFLLFLLDLIFEDDPSDICLMDTLISHLEQADDLLIFATTAKALQRKLNALAVWARDNAMSVNPKKSAILIFAATPPPPVTFYLGTDALPTKTEYCYLGFTITTTPRIGIMDLNYASQAAKAGAAGVTLFTMQAMAGTLRPSESLQLYHALIDPYITYGADFMIDAKNSLLKLFESTQISFLRRVLCLHDHSIIVVLFSELGIWPIKWRRLDLALRYAEYLIALSHDQLAWKAWAESVNLHTSFIPGNSLKTQSGWTHDLSIAFPSATLPHSYSDWSLDTISQLRKLLRSEMEQYIRSSLPASRTPAINARVYESSAPLLKRRAYLDIVAQNHRIALTRLLCASHNLAVEAMRHIRLDGSVRIAREDRICRLCGSVTGKVEDLHHVLFNCKGHMRLLTLRREFFAQLPSINHKCLPADSDDKAWNLRIIQWADDACSATALARLAWHTSRLFYSHDIAAPPIARLAVNDIVPHVELQPLDQDAASDYGSADEAA